MTNARKIELLQKLLDKSKEITTRHHTDPTFKSWRDLVERTLHKIYGESSLEVKHFSKLPFRYMGMRVSGYDFSEDDSEKFNENITVLTNNIQGYIEEISDETPMTESTGEALSERTSSKIKKIFISHASKDKAIVEELLEILELIGVPSNQIFCTSISGYGIEFGENFLERIKAELNENVLVLFVLTQNFYASPVCLCEMGATWMKTNQHIPVLIPPFQYKDIQGVIPLTQGFVINDFNALNQFKSKIESIFNLANNEDNNSWERKRNRIVERIIKHL